MSLSSAAGAGEGPRRVPSKGQAVPWCPASWTCVPWAQVLLQGVVPCPAVRRAAGESMEERGELEVLEHQSRWLWWWKWRKPEFLNQVAEGLLLSYLHFLFFFFFLNMHISEALKRSLLKNLDTSRWGFASENSDTAVFVSTSIYFSWLFQLIKKVCMWLCSPRPAVV